MTAFYVAIMTFSTMFLWFEIQQLIRHGSRYFRSPYNYVDWLAYLIPLIASALQLSDLNKTATGPVNGALSVTLFGFAILAVYLHILFELRVVEGICKIVAIMLNVTYRIKVFFCIFAGCVLAFSHAFMYIFWAGTGSMNESERVAKAENHPRSFGSSFTTIYFMMGGRYDPMDDMFESGDAGFTIMMIIYFFITVILMLNVLIALINTAFEKGETVWKVVWLESRLRFAESAENMSFIIPGFRRTHHWFPHEIYYTATPRDIKEFEERVANMASNNKRVLTGTWDIEKQPSEIFELLCLPLADLQNPEGLERMSPVVVPNSNRNSLTSSARPVSPAVPAQHVRRISSAMSLNQQDWEEMKSSQEVLQLQMRTLHQQLNRELQQRLRLQDQLDALLGAINTGWHQAPLDSQ
ncbi:hypothetical protein BG004_002094 [Podila humilis]|nr:hypothetical protein BG004_002094 [Podila humilis]